MRQDRVLDHGEMTSPCVRPIRPGEWRELRSIRLAALADAPSAFASTHDQELAYPEQRWIDAARNRSNGPLSGTFVAVDTGAGAEVAEVGGVDTGEFVGLVGGYLPAAFEPEHREEGVAELVSMWVAPAARGRGVAQELITAVVDWAAERNCHTVELWVTRGNDAAIALYEKAGFVETGAMQPLPSDPCKNEVRMRRAVR